MNIIADALTRDAPHPAGIGTSEIKQRIAGLTASVKPTLVAGNNMTAFVQTMSPEQLSETLMAIAQQLAK